MSPITTHVLDTALGRPAEGVVVVFEQGSPGDTWAELGRGATNANGRLTTLVADEAVLAPGAYRLRFLTGAYFRMNSQPVFYPEVQVQFHVADGTGHYHIPLLLSPFGYSTYRGS